eukprot:gnl/TRDRNA2_/TRDRNA2_32754_c0_seq1.p1 gnl/TRDRNA2_/TRDRNA2_32754_c0~~gnl/TRDRNA2_/TRDRNA2_32754_c0_seq1.p1  ORF type:complete len:731 (-),score=111.06 gnl/TRDRNA2_/TRDRNA2_32754_c0_seq1:65-2086(-)
MVNDGRCDTTCNNEACNYDGGDCAHQVQTTPAPAPSPPPSGAVPSPPRDNGCGCAKSWLGDGVCDSFCNTEECEFDAGDCQKQGTTTTIVESKDTTVAATTTTTTATQTTTTTTTATTTTTTSTLSSTLPTTTSTSSSTTTSPRPVATIGASTEEVSASEAPSLPPPALRGTDLKEGADSPSLLQFEVEPSDVPDGLDRISATEKTGEHRHWYVDGSDQAKNESAIPLAVQAALAGSGAFLLALLTFVLAIRMRRNDAKSASVSPTHAAESVSSTSSGASRKSSNSQDSFSSQSTRATQSSSKEDSLGSQSTRATAPGSSRYNSKESLGSASSAESNLPSRNGKLRVVNPEPKIHPEPPPPPPLPPGHPGPQNFGPRPKAAPPQGAELPRTKRSASQEVPWNRSSVLSPENWAGPSDAAKGTETSAVPKVRSVSSPLNWAGPDAAAGSKPQDSPGSQSTRASQTSTRTTSRTSKEASNEGPRAAASAASEGTRPRPTPASVPESAAGGGGSTWQDLFARVRGRNGGNAAEDVPRGRQSETPSAAGKKASAETRSSSAPGSWGKVPWKTESADKPTQSASPQKRPAAAAAGSGGWMGLVRGQQKPDDPDSRAQSLIAGIAKELERTRTGSLDDRKKTFKDLQKKYHPDKNIDDPEAAKMAFQHLMDKRQEYLRP